MPCAFRLLTVASYEGKFRCLDEIAEVDFQRHR